MNARRLNIAGLIIFLQLLAVTAYANGVKKIPEHQPPPPCKPGEHRLSESEDHGPTVQEGFAGQVQNAFVNAFRSRGVAARSEHVTISGAEKDSSIFDFAIRVSEDHCMLPHERAISRQCIKPGSQEGAEHLLTGSVQRANRKTRATVRVVKVETGAIDSTGKGDSNGTDTQAIENAVEKAIDAMDYKIACAKAVNR